MGKKKAPSRLSPSSPSPVPPADDMAVGDLAKMKAEGNKLFGKKEYTKAAEAYDRAIRNLASSTDVKEERALLHSNKAACFMMAQRFKEAVNECTSALEAVPGYHRALVRRAKAYENMGHFKQALSDIQKANRAETANPETQESEKRLKDIVSGKRPAGAPAAVANGSAVRRGPVKGRQPLIFLAKCSLGDEVRQLNLVASTSYAELLEAVRAKFPQAGPFVIKYVDKQGDLITIIDKGDVHRALGEVYEAAERVSNTGHGPRLPSLGLMPPLRLTLHPVPSVAEVPKPPADELAAMEQAALARKQLLRLQAVQKEGAGAENGEREAVQQDVEVDQWLLDFALLFREHLAVEPEGPLDLQSYAWDKLQTALDMAVRDDRAVELFDRAAARFQEMSAQGMLQWGNVLMLKGKRLVERAVLEIGSAASAMEEAESLFKLADDRYMESARIKPDFVDQGAACANLMFERAKVAAGFIVVQPDLPPRDESAGGEAASTRDESTTAAQQEALQKALARLDPAAVRDALPLFEATWEKFRETVNMVPAEEHNKPLKPSLEGQPAAVEDGNTWAHCMVMWGNLLYEYSQVLAAVGEEWRPALDKAEANFRAAGCPEDDIISALRAHTQAEHLDLASPPSNNTMVEASSSPPSTTKALVTRESPETVVKEAKGLPSLGRAKKKGVDP